VPAVTTALVLAGPAGALDARPAAERLVEAFLAGRSQETLRAYRRDVEDVARFAGEASAAQAAARLLAGGPGAANGLALAYRADLLGRGLSPATVNRRIAALRSLVKLARTLGLVTWTLEVPGLKAEAYRDTAGPGKAGVKKLLGQLAGRTDAKALRDRAIVHLAYDLGLRRKEIVGLDLEDLDLAGQPATAAVLGKGRSEKARLSLPAPTREAITTWLQARGDLPGALFVRLDRAGKGKGRLTGAAVYEMVRSLGEKAGIRARPHGLRHSAITEALDLMGGDVRAVQRFSRHKKLETLLRYDDNRRDLAGDVARRLAEAS
jgi:integrase/recombinase XerC